ncbi:glycerol-3-phosphate dehydrogenase [Photobacterium galatheae]|uniref:Glycerol-3-phosphate dehydrogenase n=1 Tax=Photobacterium galatheae TaxID=1654360 RepID=A0A066RY87_9GAMM|nr:glycerol-3-phosphate dehydrogenase [Photobacterium galatheae]KDM92348.1 glycerol-3-phosphate dehydrogenase [Photobacterium galatheae]MCM0150859.1 glycerol-3-phosphate dehydrogenase [Photobacterium galatheae]
MTAANEILDIIVVGGGINGAGIAADAAGRGLKVALFEAEDFASATSSASSKLIHGGLRYLEHYEFRLVGEALAEREVLLRKIPHIAKPMRFRLPHRPHLRPAWMIRAGLFLYDHLGKRTTLPGSAGLRFGNDSALVPEITRGFEYSDCWVDDARLVVLNAMETAARGGEVRNRCRVEKAERDGDIWQVTVLDGLTGERFVRRSHALVNAAGPWVKTFYDTSLDTPSPRNIRLIKGSHIVVPRVHDEPQAYILQNEDQRIVFVIPYLDRFSIIGTTDVEYHGDPRQVAIDEDEIRYLLKVYNAHFKHQLQRTDVVWTYSGVRPLCDDESDSPQAVTRDYTLELEQEGSQPPLLSIFGGKLTTYRKLAEAALHKLAPFFPNMGTAWTADACLPGGEAGFDLSRLSRELQTRYDWLNAFTAERLATNYGTLCWQVLDGVNSEAEMGQHFGEGFYARELDYLMNHEFVSSAEDALWRRSKLGLYLNSDQQQAVAEYIAAKRDGAHAAA